MKFFAIADMHFGHEAIIRYCNRPYKTVQEMDEDIIKKWNETVSNKDTVLVLGDVCLGSKEYGLRFMSQNHIILLKQWSECLLWVGRVTIGLELGW